MNKTLQWLTIFLLQLSALGVCYYFGLFAWVWANDVTKLSFVIFSLWVIMSCLIGKNTYFLEKGKLTREKFINTLEGGWFASDQCLSLGMLGTVIGFLIMMGSISLGSDISAIQEMLKVMSSGMATALVTTAVGIIFGNLIKLQLFLAERET
jgi:hypothetical protein